MKLDLRFGKCVCVLIAQSTTEWRNKIASSSSYYKPKKNTTYTESDSCRRGHSKYRLRTYTYEKERKSEK